MRAGVSANQPTNLLTLAQVARRLDVTQPRAAAAVRDGIWPADFLCGRLFLYRPERLDALRTALAATVPQPAAA